MTCDNRVQELLPLYAAGTLDPAQRRQVEAHLAACAECREELSLWQSIGAAVTAEDRALPAPPAALVDRALARTHRRRSNILLRAWALLRAQAPLVRREIWLTSALVMALGYLVTLVGSRDNPTTGVIEVLAPLIAAAGVAMIYGPENDPGLELALATPTSPRQVLLARLALVFSYDLALAVAASLGVILIMPAAPLMTLVLGWLGPMAFLSALALVLSLCIGAGNAVTVAMILWLGGRLAASPQLASPGGLTPALVAAAQAYALAWQSPALLLGLTGALLLAALWLAGRQEVVLPRRA